MSEYGKRLAKGTALIIASTLVIRAVGVFRSAIIARTLGPYDLGVLTIFNNVTDLFVQVSLLAIPLAIAKMIAESYSVSKKRTRRVIWNGVVIVILLSLIMSASLFMLAPLISGYYGEPRMAMLIRVYSILLFVNSAGSLASSVLQGFHKMNMLSLIGMVTSVASLPIIFVMTTTWGLSGVVYSSIIIASISLLLTLYGIFKTFREKKLDYIPLVVSDETTQILRIAFPVFIGAMLFRPVILFINSFIYKTVDPYSLGVYNVAFVVYMIVLMIPGAMQVPLLPLISEAGSKNNKEVGRFTSRVLGIMSILMLTICSAVSLFACVLIEIVYGAEYRGAIPILATLGVACYLNSISALFYSVLLGRGKTMHLLALDAIQAITLVILTVLIVPIAGILGMGLVFIFNSLLVSGLYIVIFYSKRLTDSFVFARNLSIGLTIMLICGLIGFFQTFTVVYLAIAVVVYASVVYLSYRLLKNEDKQVIVNIVKTRISWFD